MALSTVLVPLTTAWTALTTAETNVIVSVEGSASVRVALADAAGDIAVTDGHTLGATTRPSASFLNLGTKKLFARAADGVAAKVAVTKY